MASWPAFVVAGSAIGFLLGLFGAGGSSVATPVLSLLGVGIGGGGVAASGDCARGRLGCPPLRAVW
jgi:uncharacterized membrane protein YfcA